MSFGIASVLYFAKYSPVRFVEKCGYYSTFSDIYVKICHSFPHVCKQTSQLLVCVAHLTSFLPTRAEELFAKAEETAKKSRQQFVQDTPKAI